MQGSICSAPFMLKYWLWRAGKSAKPTIPLNTEECKELSGMLGLIDLRAPLGAKTTAKTGKLKES